MVVKKRRRHISRDFKERSIFIIIWLLCLICIMILCKEEKAEYEQQSEETKTVYENVSVNDDGSYYQTPDEDCYNAAREVLSGNVLYYSEMCRDELLYTYQIDAICDPKE